MSDSLYRCAGKLLLVLLSVAWLPANGERPGTGTATVNVLDALNCIAQFHNLVQAQNIGRPDHDVIVA